VEWRSTGGWPPCSFCQHHRRNTEHQHQIVTRVMRGITWSCATRKLASFGEMFQHYRMPIWGNFLCCFHLYFCNSLEQGWPQRGSRAACGSSTSVMRFAQDTFNNFRNKICYIINIIVDNIIFNKQFE
jgi:hypothetical protein